MEMIKIMNSEGYKRKRIRVVLIQKAGNKMFIYFFNPPDNPEQEPVSEILMDRGESES